MASYLLLGLFHEATPTADTIQRLHALGVRDENITVMSDMPYRPEWLGRPPHRGRVALFALVGAGLGLVTALFLTVGIWLLYPLSQGGQPLVPIPPTLIVLFEVTMLGTMWAAFFSMLLENRFPRFKSQLYDPRITEGHIGVLVELPEGLADEAEAILKANGAHHLQRVEEKRGLFERHGGRLEQYRARVATALRGPDWGHRRFWLAALAIIVVVGGVIGLIPYGVLPVSFPTQMENQVSIGYEQGPRLAAPAAAVPIQGPVLIDNQPATEPIPPSPASLQRGAVWFGLICQVCHGPQGEGNGTLSGFFTPKPANLTGDTVQKLSDADIFLVLTNGFVVMPSMAENLSVQDRWDVINHVRTLKK
jgi:mono/diheme cytochrome c family protein